MAHDPVNTFFDLSVEPPKLYASTGQHSGKVIIPKEKKFLEVTDLDRPPLGPLYADTAKALELFDINEEERSESLGYLVNRDCMSGVDDLTSIGTALTQEELDDYEKLYQKYDFKTRMMALNLPIEGFRTKIVQMVKSYQTTILKGATGCGKSTQVPQYILNSCYEQRAPCNIIVTQPRRIAARSLAQRVCAERGWELGTLVGYQVGLDKEHVSSETRLTYCTTGVLLQILVREKCLDRYTHIIIDEVHERTQEMDFVLALIKKFLKGSPAVKVILMSATFNVNRFSVYFGTYPRTRERITPKTPVTPASIIDLDKGERSLAVHNVSIFYLEQVYHGPTICQDEPSIPEDLYLVAVKLIANFDQLEDGGLRSQRGTVLVFLPGIHQIEHMFALLSKQPQFNKWLVKPLHSTLTNDDQVAVFSPTPPHIRKIILSTNIAESSVTVPDIAYVVDFMLSKHLLCDAASNFSSLQLTWASKTSCVQRAGRTGRTCDGRVYRLIHSDFYKELQSEDLPEMLRGPLERVVTLAKALDMGEPKHLIGLTLDAPDESHLNKAILLLKEKGALLPTLNGVFTWTDGDLTFLGRMMSSLPVDPAISKLIMLGHVFSCLTECIIMGAAMTLKSIFSSPFHHTLPAYHNRLSWADGSCSDPISLLNAYQTWQMLVSNGYFRRSAGGGEKDWAKRNFIEARGMHEVHTLVMELTNRLRKAGIEEARGNARVSWDKSESPLILKVILAGAFYPNYCGRGEQGGQVDEQGAVKQINGLNPFSTIYLGGMPTDQPKELYNQKIKDLLRGCSHEMVVSYDVSSKAYVQFAETSDPGILAPNQRAFNPNIPGKIVMGVYRAVKIRHLKNFLAVPMMRPISAWERAKKLGISGSKSDTWVFERKPVSENIQEAKAIKLETNMEIMISYKVDAGHFWAQNKTNEVSIKNTSWLYQKLGEPDALVPLTKRPVVGHMYAVPYSDESCELRYYRARVTSASHKANKYEVLFIDYGNSLLVKAESIRDFHPLIHSIVMGIEPLAFECVLSNIAPSIMKSPTGLWTDEAQKAFDYLTDDADLYATIYSIVHGVVSLDLHSFKRNSNLKSVEPSVAKNLIAQGFGQFAEESYLSKRNKELRDHAANTDTEVVEPDEEPRFVTQLDKQSPFDHECPIQVNLKGPHSPLEMKVYAMTRGAVRREVNIDSMSVNSVLLDTDPQDPHERLMVAASIGENSNGSRITLRHTTLMPNVHGLAALMCLLFAPKIEFRVNRLRTLYTGALCGLGFDPKTGKSIFPENDIEVAFDTEITPTDLLQINKLRYWMNKCFVSDEDNDVFKADVENMLTAKKNIKDLILTILRVHRNSQALSIAPQPHRWNLIDIKTLLVPLKNVSILCDNEKRGVFKLHFGVALDLSAEERKSIEAHLEDAHKLRALVERSEDMGCWRTCSMCTYTTASCHFMKIHLWSHAHTTREDSFRERIGMQSLAEASLHRQGYRGFAHE